MGVELVGVAVDMVSTEGADLLRSGCCEEEEDEEDVDDL